MRSLRSTRNGIEPFFLALEYPQQIRGWLTQACRERAVFVDGDQLTHGSPRNLVDFSRMPFEAGHFELVKITPVLHERWPSYVDMAWNGDTLSRKDQERPQCTSGEFLQVYRVTISDHSAVVFALSRRRLELRMGKQLSHVRLCALDQSNALRDEYHVTAI
jgi:hypothetical protein